MTTSTTDTDTPEQLNLAEIDRLRSRVESLRSANANEPGAVLEGERARISQRRAQIDQLEGDIDRMAEAGRETYRWTVDGTESVATYSPAGWQDPAHHRAMPCELGRCDEPAVWDVVRTSATTANRWRYCDRCRPQDAQPPSGVMPSQGSARETAP